MAKPKPKTIMKRQAKSKDLPGVRKTRKLKTPEYHSFRLHKRIKHPIKIPSSYLLFVRSLRILRKHWKIIGGIILIYGLLNILLVRGLGGGIGLPELKDNLDQTLQESASQLTVGFALFGALINTAQDSSNPNSSVYQSILLVMVSLALIWSLRQIQAGNKVGIRESFYRGMYPLVPFVAVLFVIGLQLVPLMVGNLVYGIVTSNGIAVTFLEKFVWALVFFLLAMLSIYMICSSVFALYISTLPDMTPMRALRSARQLVLHRRWSVMRRVLFLPVALLIIAAMLMLPLILFLTPVAEPAFFVFSMAILAMIHTYMYTLYRELL